MSENNNKNENEENQNNQENQNNNPENENHENNENNEEEENKEPLGDKISILHYIENPELDIEIESPRSIEAMKQLGFEMEDIVYITPLQFINLNPEIRSLPPEIQNRRYGFYEQYRQIKIQKIKEVRDEIKLKKTENNENNGEKENANGEQENPVSSAAINEELRQFERMKKKNE